MIKYEIKGYFQISQALKIHSDAILKYKKRTSKNYFSSKINNNNDSNLSEYDSLPSLSKLGDQISNCKKEYISYGKCIDKKLLGTQHYACENEYSNLKNCLYSKFNNKE